MIDHIKITKTISLNDEIEDKDMEVYEKIVYLLLEDYNEGGTEQLRKSLHDNFDLNYEGVIAVRVLLLLIKKIDVPNGNVWL